MLISSSAGRRCTGDTRQRSSYSLRMAASWERSWEMSAPSEDCESLAWIMKESLSSSAPRSGDVDEELLEEPLDMRWARRRGAIVVENGVVSDGDGDSGVCVVLRPSSLGSPSPSSSVVWWSACSLGWRRR